MTYSFPTHHRSSAFARWEPSSITNPKILFLAPFAPNLNAPHGGGRVIAQLLTRLADRHPLALCYLRSSGEHPIDESLRAKCEVVEEVLIPEIQIEGPTLWFDRIKMWSQLLAGKPLWAIGYSVPAYRDRVRRVVASWAPDIIQVEFHIMGQYLSALDGYPAPRILVEHEPGLEAAFEVCRYSQGQGIFMPYLELIAWQRFERSVIRQVQSVVVFTERDRRVLTKQHPQVPVVRIPFGAEIPNYPLDPTGGEPLNILFVGSFLHLPNIDAVIRLIDEIFPAVLAQFPEARLYIVGSQPPAVIQSRANEHVIVTGFVPDVEPYLDQATLVAVPLRLGGGMRVKVLEALAAGKAVVASHLAIEGLDLVNGEQVLLAETDQEFRRAIIDLFNKPEKRLSIANSARNWVCSHLSWEETIVDYEQLYRSLIAGQEFSENRAFHPIPQIKHPDG